MPRDATHIEPTGAPLEYDPQTRNYFVKYVFSIVFIMLILTAIFDAIVLNSDDIKRIFLRYNLLIVIGALIIVIAMNYVIFCSACSRVPPCNFISLFIVVIGMSLLVGAVTVRYKTEIILYAIIATVIVVAICVMLACTSFDFTSWYIYIIAIAAAFAAISMIISLTMLVMKVYYKPLHLVLLIVGTLIQVVVGELWKLVKMTTRWLLLCFILVLLTYSLNSFRYLAY
ncbi:unnamed protein product [Leptidea sinapis]|uniref:Uncharacterized protein n=1 Tax=Leptidea sinapis TaxID=189913 RepID=A0A5E4Q9A8_9NEOP|nr:unnamed protein product [Leptidea sinapis]